MKNIIYKNSSLHYRVFGNGNPLVFLHGFLEDSSMWDEFVKPFKATHQIILIDLPCHGESRFTGEECSMEFMANAVKQILDTENITNPKIIGHSMGGYVGLELTKLMPINLTLLHSNFWTDDIEKQNDRSRVIKVIKLKKDFFIKEAIPNLFYSGNRERCSTAINTLIVKANTIPEDEICAAIMGLKNRKANYEVMNTQNILFIQGELDPVMTVDKLNSELQFLSQPPQIITLKDCGHMSIWEKPKELMALMHKII